MEIHNEPFLLVRFKYMMQNLFLSKNPLVDPVKLQFLDDRPFD